MRSTTGSETVIATAAFVLLALLASAFAAPAIASASTPNDSVAATFQANPCDGPQRQNFDVRTEAELNQAIRCFNSGQFGAGSYTITLIRDVPIRTERGGDESLTTPIDQPAAGYQLTINGNRNFIEAPDQPGPTADSLFTMTERNQALVEFDNVLFSLPFEEAQVESFVWNQSPAQLIVRSTTFFDELGVLDEAIRVDNGGLLTVQDSMFFLGDLGISAKKSPVLIDGSSFVRSDSAASFGYGLIVEGGGTLDILNSTFDQAEIGAIGVNAVVRNSTITGAGFIGNPSLSISSSIVNQCGGAAIDEGNNVGACFGPEIQVGRALDNGCPGINAVRCPWTIPISAQSPAARAGNCSQMRTDQRGVDRTPVGLGCDAGSFERTQADPGDTDNSGMIDNADVQALLMTLSGGSPPSNLDAGDLTGDGQIKLDDVLALAQSVLGQ